MQKIETPHEFLNGQVRCVAMDNLRYRLMQHPSHWSYPMNTHAMKSVLGLPPKLPRDGLPPRMIGNVKVWVEASSRPEGTNFRRPHRIMSECPCCQKTIPAGRLAQHMKVHK